MRERSELTSQHGRGTDPAASEASGGVAGHRRTATLGLADVTARQEVR